MSNYKIELLSGDLGRKDWTLSLTGDSAGQSEAIVVGDALNPASISISRLEVEVTEGEYSELVTQLNFAKPINLPLFLIKTAELRSRFKTFAELEAEILRENVFRARFEALRNEAIRRLQKIEANIHADGFVFVGAKYPFGKPEIAVGAEVGLNLSSLHKVDGEISADLCVIGKAQLSFAGNSIESRVGLAVEISSKIRVPELRFDLPDLGLSLPKISLPDWKFPDDGNWSLPQLGSYEGAARVFKRLLGPSQLSVTISTKNGITPALALRLENGALDWALVDRAKLPDRPADWAAPAMLSQKLASFSFDIRNGGTSVGTISGVTMCQVAGQVALTGNVNVPLNQLSSSSGRKEFGPLEIEWEDVVTNLSAPVGGGQPATVVANVQFKRLILRLVDEPDAVFAFRGEIELSDTNSRVVELELVEPYPIELIARGAGALIRGAGSVIRVAADFAKATAKQIKKLLEILARMAAAVGRRVALVASEVGEMLTKALAGIAQALGDALRKLGDLDISGVHTSAKFTIEASIGGDPFELRQVLITLRGFQRDSPVKVSAMGLNLTYENDWNPGLLLDFVDDPGAYLTVTKSAQGAGTQIATLSTDLWLKNESSVTALRDADSSTGERSSEPLLSLSLEKSAQTPDMVVLCGLRRGLPIWLQKFKVQTTPGQNPPGAGLRVIEGPYVMENLEGGDINLKVSLNKDRILPLFGMGEPPNADSNGGPSFLDQLKDSLGNVVWVKDVETTTEFETTASEGRAVIFTFKLGVKAAGVETEVTRQAKLSLETFEVRFAARDANILIKSRRREERALGLVWVIEQADPDERKADAEVEMFRMGFAGGQSGFELNRPADENASLKRMARMELRFEGLSADGKGIVFEVETFKVGPGGLDLVAKVKDDPVRLNGLNAPFRFTAGRLEIKGGKVVHATAEGRGSLPPDLVGDAACSIALAFGYDEKEGLILQSGKVRIEKVGEPIVCRAMRFTLTITDLDIGIIRDGGYHFFFLVTGSLRFTPAKGEFDRGLLQYLDDIELALERTPLAADPRVLARHIVFQKALNPKKTFNLFNLFTFELRGFGYHPAAPKFGGDPAINLSGQIRFVDMGDVMQPSIEFHGLWMALPKKGESLPRIEADGLGVDLNLKGSIRVRGSVLALDHDTRSVEGAEYAPAGYDMSGFLGTGELAIPGFGDFAANLGFVELERQDRPGDRKHAFYLYGEKRRTAVEIVTPIWVFYMREFGFGFGYRYTLEALKAADDAGASVPKLIKTMDEVAKRQGDLHRMSAWRPDPDGDKVTLALKGAIQPYYANKIYDETKEEKAESPFFFDLVAAIRSDFTLFMGLRGWMGANYYDYLNDTEGMRSNPGLRGYLYISPQKKMLLARALGDRNGFIGDRVASLARQQGQEPLMRRALRSIDWSSTLFIKPGLFHYELGWPDQLSVRLIDTSNMRVMVRGGMIFRAAEDGLLLGYNIEADAFFRFGGQIGSGAVGVAASATLDVRFVARVLAFLSSRVQGSLVYGLIALDATLKVNFAAWLRVDLRFTSFTIHIGFSQSLQLSAAVEAVISTEGFGAKVDARVGVSVFGRTLSVGIGFALNDGQLSAARARVQRFLAISLTTEEPEIAPVEAATSGNKAIEQDAQQALAPSKAPEAITVAPPVQNHPEYRNRNHTIFGVDVLPSDFWLIMRKAEALPTEVVGLDGSKDYAYAFLIPKEGVVDDEGNAQTSSFFAIPKTYAGTGDRSRDETVCSHKLQVDAQRKPDLFYSQPKMTPSSGPAVVRKFEPMELTSNGDLASILIPARWNAPVENDANESRFTLAHLFDECFLYQAEWEALNTNEPWRKTTEWREPKPRIHRAESEVEGDTHDARTLAREQAQRAHDAERLSNEIVDAVHQARSTVLSMFIEQFLAIARSGKIEKRRSGASEMSFANVADLGLVFFGTVEELEKLQGAKIYKNSQETPGTIEILNRREHWFDQVDPILAPPAKWKRPNRQGAVTPEGIKLAWELKLPFGQNNFSPEHFLECYEIRRTIDNKYTSRVPTRVKRAATFGNVEESSRKVPLLASDWQYVDDLSDIDPNLRRVLLPPSDDTGALAAAVAWAEIFFDREEVLITYSVTPCDISGTKGDPQGFVVSVRRPEAPIRGAAAELRFVVTNLDDQECLTKGTMPRDSLGVVMAMKDDSFQPDGFVDSLSSEEITVERKYFLIADPQAIEPSGRYGSGGMTERKSAGGISYIKSADHLVWELPYVTKNSKDRGWMDLRQKDGKVPVDTEIDPLEPDHDTLTKFPLWRALSGRTKLPDDRVDKYLEGTRNPKFAPKLSDQAGTKVEFLESLWSRDGRRVATQFWLVTRQVVRRNGLFVAQFQSKPTAVPVELRLLAKKREDENNSPPIVMRPEAFEWPVHLPLPPLAMGQVRANSGFALFRMPNKGKSFQQLLTEPEPLCVLPDPARRILTEISFDANPRWSGKISPQHKATIAGYDLHELDLDDLAPLDTSESDLKCDFAAWRRARRVASIERINVAEAGLLPGDTKDWQGWQAHYPSEAWRIHNRPKGRGDSVPLRAPWYSAAESTLGFAERYPRLRFFPTAPEHIVQDLTRHGLPTHLVVRLEVAPGSAAESNLCPNGAKTFHQEIGLRLFRLNAEKGDGSDGPIGDGLNADLTATEMTITFQTAVGAAQPFTVSQINAVLLRLGWGKPGSPKWTDLVDRFKKNPAALDGLAVSIAANARVTTSDNRQIEVSTGSHLTPLALSAFVHPLLEEVLGEFEYSQSADAAPVLYRRYVVNAQSVQPAEGTRIEDFMAGTPPEKDPYGWAALHQLGLAATVSLYDRDHRRFLNGEKLARRVSTAMSRAVARYFCVYSKMKSRSTIGFPFADVLLKPSCDRVPGSFETIRDANMVESSDLDLASDGLSIIQLALRPVPVAGMKYATVKMAYQYGTSGANVTWPDALVAWRERTLNGGTRVRDEIVIDGYDLEVTNPYEHVIEVIRAATGSRASIAPGAIISIPLLPPPRPGKQRGKIEPGLSMHLRLASDEDETLVKSNIKIRARIVTREANFEGDKVVVKSTVQNKIVLNELSNLIPAGWIGVYTGRGLSESGLCDVSVTTISGPLLKSSKEDAVSPFERFGLLSANAWGALVEENANAEELGELEPGTPKNSKDVHAAFNSLVQNLRITAPDLDWAKGLPAFKVLRRSLSSYLTWSQRFLDHAAEPAVPKSVVYFSLAAPIKALPWRLAANEAGRIKLSFLHSDRWAHTRAYAVQPTSRYDHLSIGAGWLEQAGSEQLQLKLNCEKPPQLESPVGYALAVSPRTETIEPPVIMGSRLVQKALGEHSWELVLARHGEENLAFSNRPLFARLGTEGTAVTFAREYRYPKWPGLLVGCGVSINHPKIKPDFVQAAPSQNSRIEGAALAEISGLHPELYQGADILRVEHLLPHYRLIALAIARAGIVVSKVVTATQDATPRRALPDLNAMGFPNSKADKADENEKIAYANRAKELLGNPTIKINKGGDGNTYIHFENLRMVSHADLAEKAAHDTWLEQSREDDIAWWPDPEVTYALFRSTKLPSSASVTVEEEAVITASATGFKPEAGPAELLPFKVRFRGSLFEPGEPVAVTKEVPAGGAGPIFRLNLKLRFKPGSGLSRRFREDDATTDEQRKRFRHAVAGFATLLREYTFSVQVTPKDYNEREVAKLATSISDKLLELLNDGAIKEPLRKEIVDYQLEFAKIANEARKNPLTLPIEELRAMLSKKRSVALRLDFDKKIDLSVDALFSIKLVEGKYAFLNVANLPPDDKVNVIATSGHPLAATPLDTPGALGGLFWRVARELLLGGADKYFLRAVDTRNAIDLVAPTGQRELEWTAPGEIEIDVTLPEWVIWGKT